MMAADCLEALGIKRGEYVIKVNNRKVLDGVMEAIGLGGAEHAARRLVVLRAIDKLDRLGPEGVRALLGEGRKDESGDFTKGAGLIGERNESFRTGCSTRGQGDAEADADNADNDIGVLLKASSRGGRSAMIWRRRMVLRRTRRGDREQA